MFSKILGITESELVYLINNNFTFKGAVLPSPTLASVGKTRRFLYTDVDKFIKSIK
jgi:hypothetical protein